MAPTPLLPRKSSDFTPITTVHNHVSIAAPPLIVLTTVLNTTTWPSWNTFNPTATIYYRPEPVWSQPQSPSHPAALSALFASPDFLSPGCKFGESHSEESKKSVASVNDTENLEILAIEELQTEDGKRGYRIVWRLLDWNEWLMKSRRVHEFVEGENGQTEYNSWTELGGLFAWPLKWASGDSKIGVFFDETFKSLKEFVEGGATVAVS
jgi:hypothetical protein